MGSGGSSTARKRNASKLSIRNYSAESSSVYETVPTSSASQYGNGTTYIDFQDYIKSWGDGNAYRSGKLQAGPCDEYEKETKQSIYMGLMPYEGRECRNIYENSCPIYSTLVDSKKNSGLLMAASSVSSDLGEDNPYVDHLSFLLRGPRPTKFSHQLGESVSSCLPTSTEGHQPEIRTETEVGEGKNELRAGDDVDDYDNNREGPCVEDAFNSDSRTQIVEVEVDVAQGEGVTGDRFVVDELSAETKTQPIYPDEYEEFTQLDPYSAYKQCHMTLTGPQSQVIPTALVPMRTSLPANPPLPDDFDISPATRISSATPSRAVHDVAFFTVKSGQQAKLDRMTVNVPAASQDVEVGWARKPSDLPPLSAGQRALTGVLHCLPHGANFLSPVVVALDVPDIRGDAIVWYSPTDVGQTPVWEKWTAVDSSKRDFEMIGPPHRSDSNRALHLRRWRKVVLLLRHLCSFVVVENDNRYKLVTIEVFLKTKAIDSRSVVAIIKTTLSCDQRKLNQKTKSIVKDGYRKVEDMESILYEMDQRSTFTIGIRDLVLLTGSIKRKQVDPMTHSLDVAWSGAVVASQFWMECIGMGSVDGHLAFTVSLQQEGQTDNAVRAFCNFRTFDVREERRRCQDRIQKSESESELRLISDSYSTNSDRNDETCHSFAYNNNNNNNNNNKESSICALLGQASKIEDILDEPIRFDDSSRTAAARKEHLETSGVRRNSKPSISKDVERKASLKRHQQKEIAENRPIADRILAAIDLSKSADRTELEQNIRGLYS